VTHWIGSGELPALSSGKVLTVGPIAGEAPRILTYALLKVVGGDSVVVRLAVPASELAEDLRERRAILLGHALSLVILLLVGGLALFPVGPESSSHAALDAYEEAMRRLRERGQAVDREHEEERQRLAHDLEDKEALARAGELTAGIVHEVRNGLGTILGYARLLERRAEGGEVRETAVLIRRECETLESVVRRFMDFVRRETLAPAPFDVGRMLARVVGRESRARPGPRATLEGEFGSISADEELLERAFENLVRNALEAAGNDGQVRIEGKREESGLRIEVRDDGPGMSPQDLEHIRPFYTTKPGGLGLGLAIASKVVELHRGEMLLRPAFPKGLSVGVYLPFEPPREVNVTDSSVQSRM
jgi:signal transduction histidine kinase